MPIPQANTGGVVVTTGDVGVDVDLSEFLDFSKDQTYNITNAPPPQTTNYVPYVVVLVVLLTLVTAFFALKYNKVI